MLLPMSGARSIHTDGDKVSVGPLCSNVPLAASVKVSHHTNQGDCHTLCGSDRLPQGLETYTMRNEFEVSKQ